MEKVVLKSKFVAVLKYCTVFVFLGRGYQHIFWDAPYRAFFWDESLLEGVVNTLFRMTWNDYVTSPSISNGIVMFIKCTGVFYLLCAIGVYFIKPSMKKLGKLLLLGGGLSLFILAFLYSKDRFFHVGQFFEYTAQFMSPILLYLLMFSKVKLEKIKTLALIVIALTFICHGLYAIGYYPIPGIFMDMTLNILPVTEPIAHSFLKIAGILDFIVAIAIFIPKVSKMALWYMVVWGGLTAIARLVGHFYIDFLGITFSQWTWEVFVRLPHALLPLFVIYVDKQLLDDRFR